jgi:hypothetical protein
MIKTNIYPHNDNLYSLAYEGDAELGSIGPSGHPWRVLNTTEIDTEEKRTAVKELERN